MSFLPLSKDVYAQMPYEEIEEREYERMMKRVRKKGEIGRKGEQAVGDHYCDVCGD